MLALPLFVSLAVVHPVIAPAGGNLRAFRTQGVPKGVIARALHVDPQGRTRDVVFPQSTTRTIELTMDESLGLMLRGDERVVAQEGFRNLGHRPYQKRSGPGLVRRPLILHAEPDWHAQVTIEGAGGTRRTIAVTREGGPRWRSAPQIRREVDAVLAGMKEVPRRAALSIANWAESLFDPYVHAYANSGIGLSPQDAVRSDRSLHSVWGASSVLDGEIRAATGGAVSRAGRKRIAEAFRLAAQARARDSAGWEARQLATITDHVDVLIDVARRLAIMRARADKPRG
jgi:hypothetical protein